MNRYYPLIFTGLCAVLAAACEPQEAVQAELYETAPVEYHDIRITVEAAGTIQPETTVDVKSKASGEILVINAETGDFVQEGDLLVQIDKRTPGNTVAQSEADLEAAKARRQIAITQINRTRNLLERGIVIETEYETAELELANAEALVITRQIDLENARIALDDTDIRAPISGIVIEKNVERGQVISSSTRDVGEGTILLKMADLSTVQVKTLVDETDIGKIRPGMPVTVKVAAFPNQPFTGEVLKIEPLATVEQNVTMFPVIIRLENLQGLLRPGMNAEVNISIARAENVLSVPTIGLRTDRDIAATAAFLGITGSELRKIIADSRADRTPSAVAARMGVNGRADPGVFSREAETDMDPAARQRIIQAMGPGGARPGGGVRRGETALTGSSIDYQFGGEYWVLVLVNGSSQPRTVRTGITDLEYSEIVSGLTENDRVLILPSSGLIERQERMQERLSQRMRLPGMGH